MMMSELKKGGIRAVMSESTERETLKQMGQRTTQNTTDNEPGEALLPCPFCGVRMIRSGLDQPHWQQWWEHQDRETSRCVLKNQTISDASKVYKAAWNSRASVAAPQPPMCAVHAALDGEDKLVLEVGNGCIACSLHERTALLNLLEPFAADDASQDSLTVLRGIIASAAAASSAPAEPPSGALIQLLEAALLHPESAEGNIRRVIEALNVPLDDNAALTAASIVEDWYYRETEYRESKDGELELLRERIATALSLAANENKRLREHIADLNHDLEAAIKECNEQHG